MKELKTELDSKCPKVHLRPDGHFEITGKCIPDQPRIFFAPVMEWLDEYVKNPAPKTILDMKVIYCNSFSKKFFIAIFCMLKALQDNGLISEVNWYYEEGDDDMKEMADVYHDSSNMDIKAISYNPDV